MFAIIALIANKAVLTYKANTVNKADKADIAI